MVTLNEASHTYHDHNGNEYISVSKLLSLFQKPFDRHNISIAYAKNKGLSVTEVLAQWDKKRDDSINHGNRIHFAMEKYFNSATIDPENIDLKPMIISVAKEYSKYYRIFQEEIIYNQEFLIAGKTDNRFQITSSHKSIIDFGDYKTNLSRGIEYSNKYNQYLLGPINHLIDCNYNKYALQLSTYAYLYQLKTNCKIGSLHILYIPPDDFLQYTRIPVPYLKLEVKAMIEHYLTEKNKNKSNTEILFDI